MIACGVLAHTALHANAQAVECPQDASRASYSIWKGGDVPTGAVVAGTHACGKKLRCVGSTQTGPNRQFKWIPQ